MSNNQHKQTSSENKQQIKALQTAIDSALSGKMVDVGEFFSDDVIWHLPQSTGQTHEGKAAVLAMFSGDVAKFYKPETMKFQHLSLIAEDDLVHSHFSLTATTSNGQPYHNHYQTLYRLRDGKICEVWEYFDTAYLFGLFPQQ